MKLFTSYKGALKAAGEASFVKLVIGGDILYFVGEPVESARDAEMILLSRSDIRQQTRAKFAFTDTRSGEDRRADDRRHDERREFVGPIGNQVEKEAADLINANFDRVFGAATEPAAEPTIDDDQSGVTVTHNVLVAPLFAKDRESRGLSNGTGRWTTKGFHATLTTEELDELESDAKHYAFGGVDLDLSEVGDRNLINSAKATANKIAALRG